MRLAPDTIAISTGLELVELRPSLRAATRIARRYDGFAAVIDAIVDGNLTVMADLIREGSEGAAGLADLIEDIGHDGLGLTLAQLTQPLTRFVMELVGFDPDAETDPHPTGEPIPFAVYFRRLFQIATGWLGWPRYSRARPANCRTRRTPPCSG